MACCVAYHKIVRYSNLDDLAGVYVIQAGCVPEPERKSQRGRDEEESAWCMCRVGAGGGALTGVWENEGKGREHGNNCHWATCRVVVGGKVIVGTGDH